MNYIKYTLIIAFALIISACGDDYLNTYPTASTATSNVFSSTEKAQMAVNGICRMMSRQYLSNQGMNGEGTMLLYYGDFAGNSLSNTRTTSPMPGLCNLEYVESTSSSYNYFAWYYYYMIIGNANTIIANIDGAEGKESDRQFVRAEALTLRAYSYFQLSQMYCKRWVDSNNGASDGLVLRLDPTNDPMALCTLAEVYAQVYKDLDEAISLFDLSEADRADDLTNRYLPNIDVAYAVYARAAITRCDYQNAAKYAEMIIANPKYKLMSNEEYKAGFSYPNNEWIWYVYSDVEQDIRFYSFAAYIAYNSTATQCKTYPKLISKELFDKIPASDIRRSLFLDPTGYTYTAATGAASTKLKNHAYELYPELSANSAKIYAYMNFKFIQNSQPGVANLCLFRTAEMYYLAAEAEYFLNNPKKVQELLVEVTKASGRDPSYSCTKTSEELLNEIKTYKAFDLWAEGQEFFDLKRWKDSIVRKAWVNGGNFNSAYAITISPSDCNGWVYMIPVRETNYNPLIFGNESI